jgi:hypothetical protein
MALRWKATWLAACGALGACSLLNAPDDALTTGDAPGGGGEAPSASGGTPSGGSGASAGSEPIGEAGMGAGTGVGGCGSECDGEGGAPPIGRECESSADDCGSTAPICDPAAGECRACASDDECEAEVARPFCVASGASAGRCTECKKSTDCAPDKPVCGNAGLCRACSEHEECASGVCEADGACGDPATAVYALAETGVSGTSCGTIDTPCYSLATAATKLTAQRSTLVLLKTTAAFITGKVMLPAVKGIRVIGNGVSLKPYDGASGYVVPPMGAAVFENVFVSGVTLKDGAAIECTGGSIVVTGSLLQTNSNAIVASDCDVTVTGSVLQGNDQPHLNAQAAIRASCTTENCAKTTTFLRNRFVENGVAAYVVNQANVNFENNLFLGNGADGYTRVIELRAKATHFAYNTLVRNFNGCSYVGIVACIGACNNVANISHNNFPDEAQPCYDQVWYGGTMSYNLTEVPFPGATNKTGDPLFVDAANGDFTPGAGSPALDNGDPADMPPGDFNGNKRPVGDGPDIGAIEAQ